MAKLTGPLMSMAAAGNVAGVIEFRKNGDTATAQRWTTATTKPTAAQLAARQRAAWAADSWRSLDAFQRAEWAPLAAARSLPVFGCYMQQFIAQQCGLGQQPQRPQVAQ